MRYGWKMYCGLGALTALAHAVLADAAQAKSSFTIYGFAQMDYIYDVHRVDPAWEDSLRPSKIPTTPGIYGSDGQSIFSVKQSRFGVMGDVPVGQRLDDVSFKFEFDMYGVGADAGQTTIRLRHAFGEWGQLLVGQTNSNFMDIDSFPNVIDYWGPTGMIFLRNPQIRWTPYRTDQDEFSIAIEKPSNDIDIGNLRVLAPELGPNIRNDEKLPDLTARFATRGDWGHFQLAGILREVAYDTVGTVDNIPKGSSLGWGINASGHANVFENDKLQGSVVYGEGIASYMNDGGTDLAPKTLQPLGVTPNSIKATAIPILGLMAYYEHAWNSRWSSTMGYSMNQVENANLQAGTAYKRGEYASVNLVYKPVKSVMIGGEFLWGKRTDFNGATGNDPRIQISVKYDFSHTL